MPPKRKKRKLASGDVADAEAPAEVAEPVVASASTVEPKKKKRKLASGDAADAQVAEPIAASATTAECKKKKKRQPPETSEVAAPAAEVSVPAEKPLSRGIKKRLKAKNKNAAVARPVDAAGKEAGPATADAAPSATNDQAGDHTIFVDGVPYMWDLEKIRQLFGRCGQVLEVRAPSWQDSGRLRGYAHVSFARQKEKEEALAMDGIKVGSKGRYLKIESAKGASSERSEPTDKNLEGKRRLFVKNLPYDATEAEIKELFAEFGKIVDIRVPTSFGRSKGFAYVEYAAADCLKKAVTEGAELRGRKLFLDADSSSGPKAGFHYRREAFDDDAGNQPRGRGRGHGAGKGSGRGGFGRA